MRLNFVQKIIDKIRNKKPKKAESEIKQHPKRASNAQSMKQFTDWIKNYTDFKPQIIFEIGANYAQDAEGLRYYFNLPEENVWVFEAHPDICKEISKLYNFHIFNNAVYNEEKIMEFNAVDINVENNSGVSSLLGRVQTDCEYKMKNVQVKSIRMDNFMNENKIEKIDFLKLDVEGCNWEVLDGFGDRLKDVEAIHIESEHVSIWEGQKLYNDIRKKLEENDFVLVFFQRYYSQSDSFWIKNKYLKTE